MEKKLERSNGRKVLRRVAPLLRELGFAKSTASLFVRAQEHVVEFVSIHKFSFDRAFRVTFGIRLYNDPFPGVGLNGPASDLYETPSSPNGKKYNFYYHVAEDTLERCARNIADFCGEVGDPWFRSWRPVEKLLDSPESPLTAELKGKLASAVTGNADSKTVEETKRLFGVV